MVLPVVEYRVPVHATTPDQPPHDPANEGRLANGQRQWHVLKRPGAGPGAA